MKFTSKFLIVERDFSRWLSLYRAHNDQVCIYGTLFQLFLLSLDRLLTALLSNDDEICETIEKLFSFRLFLIIKEPKTKVLKNIFINKFSSQLFLVVFSLTFFRPNKRHKPTVQKCFSFLSLSHFTYG
jgi:hypothetical protein